MTRARILTPWGLSTPLSIPQQMTARVRRAQEDNREVHIVGCVIERLPNGNLSYTVTNSPMPSEVALMAAHEISKAMDK